MDRAALGWACFALVLLSACERKPLRAVAMELDGRVIYEETCAPKKMVACGRRVREKARVTVCATHGKGTHRWQYRAGNSKPLQQTSVCK